jgi:hypothetical protein
MEEFVMSLSPEERDFAGDGDLTPAILSTLHRDFREGEFTSDELVISAGSAGYGADAYVVTATFASLAGLFLAGKKIEENLDAWLRLGRRFKRLVTHLRSRGRAASVSEPIALSLTLERLERQLGDIAGANLMISHVIPVHNGSIPSEREGVFESQPDRLYIFALRLGNHDTIVTGVRSDGTVEFEHRVPTGRYLEYFGIIDSKANLAKDAEAAK